VYHATGRRIRDLPITLDKLLLPRTAWSRMPRKGQRDAAPLLWRRRANSGTWIASDPVPSAASAVCRCGRYAETTGI